MTDTAGWRSSAMSWLAARSVRQMLLAGGAVLLLVSGLFGGLRAAPSDPVVPLKAGVAEVSEPFEITVEGAYWSDDLGEVIGPPPLGRYLLVVAQIRNTSQRSVDGFVVREALRFKGLSGFGKSALSSDVPVASELADPATYVVADQVQLGELGPGLTYEVAFVWSQDTAQALPDQVEVLTRAHGFRRSSLDDQENWFDTKDDAVGTFPLTKFGDS